MSARLQPYDHLFSPIAVNQLTICNRIVMGPMGNLGMADADGRPTAKMIAYFAERAKGGAGLITSGLVPVSPGIDPAVPHSGAFPQLGGTRDALSGWRDLAEAVHAYGASFFAQLSDHVVSGFVDQRFQCLSVSEFAVLQNILQGP